MNAALKLHLLTCWVTWVGSGVSIVRVDGDTEYKRIDGTSLGGGTFWGLCNMITGVDDFDEMLSLSLKGAHLLLDTYVSI